MQIRSQVRIFVLLCIGLILGTLNSCTIDKDLGKGASITPHYQLPLTYGQLKVTDVLTDSSGVLVIDDADNSLKVVSISDTFDYFLGDRARIQPATALRTWVLGASSVGDQNLDIDATGITFPNQLREALIITSNFEVRIVNLLDFDLQNITVTFPGIRSTANVPLTMNIPLITANTTEIRTVDVNGYNIDFGKNNTTFNIINAEIDSDPTVNTGTIAASDRVDIQIRFITPVVKKIRGTFFSQPAIRITAGANVLSKDQFDNIKSGSIEADKAKITLHLSNTAGFPYYAKLGLETVSGVDTTSKITLLRNGTDTADFLLVGAIEQGGEPVNDEAANTKLIQNGPPENYNVGAFISNFPTRININAYFKDSVSNPGAFNSVMYNNSQITGYVEAEMPLSIKFNNLVLEDTLDFDVLAQFGDQISDTQQIKLDTGTFYFRLINAFPYDFNIDVDAFNEIGDSLAQITSGSGIQISAGTVDAPSQAPLSEVPISDELFDKLKAAKKIRVRARIDNGNHPTITDFQLYTNQYIDFKVFGDIKIRAKFD
jgi:hypothetical protein